MTELEYIPDGSEFDDDDTRWATSLADFDNEDVIKEAQRICGRTVNIFRKKPERTKWMRIDKKITKGIISQEWIDNRFEIARELNQDRLKITMDKLAVMILNLAAMTDFHSRMAEDRGLATDATRDLAEDGF